MRRVALIVGLAASAACRSMSTGGPQPEKRGDEQTEGPAVVSGEEKFPGTAPGKLAPLSPLGIVQFQPHDLMTSAGDGPVRLGVISGGQPLGSAALSQLASAVRLYTWPGRRPVPATVTFTDVTGPDHGEHGYSRTPMAFVEIAPTEKLANEWYWAAVDNLPPSFAWPEFGPHHKAPDGSRGVRFSPAPHLVVSAVRVCEKAQDKAVVLVDFSERVSPNTDEVTLSGPGQLGCTRLTEDGSAAESTVRFLCNRAEVKNLRLSIKPTIKAMSGVALEAPVAAAPGEAGARATNPAMQGPLEVELAEGKFAPWGDRCRVTHP
jgi:hypothetical protein